MQNIFLVYLHSIGFSQKSLGRIFEKNTNYEDFYNKLDREVLQKMKVREEKTTIVLEKKASLDTEKIQKTMEALSIQIIPISDERYPELLKQSPICPYFLYVRWTLKNLPALSIVGSRKSTSYSRNALINIIPTLIQNDYVIVSWGAYGVDSLAHSITIENKGYTISVFGTGIDQCYPKENRELFEKIIQSGWALISAFPIGTKAEIYNFPIRNEIVAGISRWVLVTEANEKSGTLITAGLALDFWRDVFALPGDITKPTSMGANMLIRDGQAKLVLDARDILSEYTPLGEIMQETKKVRDFTSPLEAKIYELLEKESSDISTISELLEQDIQTISYTLSLMEIHWIVEMGIGGGYRTI